MILRGLLIAMALLMAIWTMQADGAERCLTCNSCKMVEVTSQSASCQPNKELCFVSLASFVARIVLQVYIMNV